MSEIARLGAAIKVISERYLGNVIRAGDTEGILKWSTRLADYSTRLAALVAPPLTMAEKADVTVDDALSADPSVAAVQLLTAIGLPPEARDGGLITASPQAILAAASPEQNAELTLLGFFGTPDSAATFPTADYTLYVKYHEPVFGGWAPKEGIEAAWPAYIADIS
jgi:hypothetical protein